MAQFSIIPTGESTGLAEDIRELFDDLSRSLPQTLRAYSGECHPSLDVVETDDAVEVVMDLAGVSSEAVRVVFRGGVLIIAGEKAAPSSSGEQSFHLVERDFGRFARAVRLNGAFDIPAARATLRDGELAIVLPKLTERRGQPHTIPVTS